MNRKAAKVICTAVITLTTLVYPNVSNAQTKDYKLSIQEVVRLSGQDRFETAVKVSKHGWQNGSDTVVLAREMNSQMHFVHQHWLKSMMHLYY